VVVADELLEVAPVVAFVLVVEVTFEPPAALLVVPAAVFVPTAVAVMVLPVLLPPEPGPAPSPP
jgi:hypothetical protein